MQDSGASLLILLLLIFVVCSYPETLLAAENFDKVDVISASAVDFKKLTQRGLLFIPGYGGDPRRHEIIERNLQKFDKAWDCLLFRYRNHVRISRKIREKCIVVNAFEMSWAEIMKYIRPEFVFRRRYAYITVLLDDVLLGEDFDIKAFLHVMQTHELDVASPSIYNSSHSIMAPFRDGTSSASYLGRLTSFVEIQATVFSNLAWLCFWDALDIKNKGGWAFDVCMFEICRPRIGIIDIHMATHVVALGTTQAEPGIREKQAWAWLTQRSKASSLFTRNCTTFGKSPYGRILGTLTT